MTTLHLQICIHMIHMYIVVWPRPRLENHKHLPEDFAPTPSPGLKSMVGAGPQVEAGNDDFYDFQMGGQHASFMSHH